MTRSIDFEAVQIMERILDQIDEVLYEELAGLDEKLSNKVRSLLEGHAVL